MPGRLLPMGRMSPWVLDEAQARDDLDELAALLAPRTPLSDMLWLSPQPRLRLDQPSPYGCYGRSDVDTRKSQ